MPAMLASGFDQGTLPSRSRGTRHVQGDFGKNRRNLEVFFVKLRAGRSLYVDSIRRNTCCECELNDYNSYADKARPGLRSSSADPDPRFPHRRFGSTRFDRGRFDFALRSGVRRLRRMPLRGKHFFHGLHLGERPERPVDQLIETLLEGELVRQPPADRSRGAGSSAFRIWCLRHMHLASVKTASCSAGPDGHHSSTSPRYRRSNWRGSSPGRTAVFDQTPCRSALARLLEGLRAGGGLDRSASKFTTAFARLFHKGLPPFGV